MSGNKLVESQFKQYATKNDFSAAVTTNTGKLAVASNKGDIRLFDRLGIRAKTQLPALGKQCRNLIGFCIRRAKHLTYSGFHAIFEEFV